VSARHDWPGPRLDGQESQGAAEPLRPTAKDEKSFCIAELPHRSQICLPLPPAFSRNSIVCSHSVHLYSNIGIYQSPFRRSSALSILQHETTQFTAQMFGKNLAFGLEHKKRVFVQIFKKMSRNQKFLIVQGNFGKFIDVVRRSYVL